ncbi:MAG: isoprenyl transferase [Clostridia bacterium]|nr:isoprenyl transferase [Clostridia bacterium]
MAKEKDNMANNTDVNINDENAPQVPKHIAIIMDGNGRWARRRGMPRVAGHNAGMKALKEIVRICSDMGVKYLTVYAFSTENWKRPQDEVTGIFKIMVYYIQKELRELAEKNVRIRVLGNWDAIPEEAEKSMEHALAETEKNDGMVFNIALNYGGRTEITDAFRKIAAEAAAEGKSPEEFADSITEELIGSAMTTAGMPDPDMIIRTGGEMRLSNFLLWQCAYSEFIYTDVFWPDFDEKELKRCIEEFNSRHRRYGGL